MMELGLDKIVNSPLYTPDVYMGFDKGWECDSIFLNADSIFKQKNWDLIAARVSGSIFLYRSLTSWFFGEDSDMDRKELLEFEQKAWGAIETSKLANHKDKSFMAVPRVICWRIDTDSIQATWALLFQEKILEFFQEDDGGRSLCWKRGIFVCLVYRFVGDCPDEVERVEWEVERFRSSANIVDFAQWLESGVETDPTVHLNGAKSNEFSCSDFRITPTST